MMTEYRFERKEGYTRYMVKRFHLPYDVHTSCPKCKQPVTRSEEEYVSNPVAGAAMDLDFCCYNSDLSDRLCEHEWSVKVVMDVTLRLADVATRANAGKWAGSLPLQAELERGLRVRREADGGE